MAARKAKEEPADSPPFQETKSTALVARGLTKERDAYVIDALRARNTGTLVCLSNEHPLWASTVLRNREVGAKVTSKDLLFKACHHGLDAVNRYSFKIPRKPSETGLEPRARATLWQWGACFPPTPSIQFPQSSFFIITLFPDLTENPFG